MARRGGFFVSRGTAEPATWGLATCADISLASAREIAEECRKLLKQGLDPIEARKKTAGKQHSSPNCATFKEAVDRYIAAHEPSWKNPKHRQQWRNTLGTYAIPVIGDMDVAEIATEDILRVLEPIWRTKPETAVARPRPDRERSGLVPRPQLERRRQPGALAGASEAPFAGAQEEGDGAASSGHALARAPRVHGRCCVPIPRCRPAPSNSRS